MSTSRIIVGSILTLGGFAIIVMAFFVSLFSLIYGIPMSVLGLVILFNSEEDEIEQRKDFGKNLKSSKGKK